MNLPFFYVEQLAASSLTLDEDTSRHMTGVLRMQKGEEVLLTDGKGKKARATITDDHRKKTVVSITSLEEMQPPPFKTSIGISLVKNTARFEWFLEKATELGIDEIIPLVCARTEKEKFREDRLRGILVSAMLQSQQCRLPLLHPPTSFEKVLPLNFDQKFIAHCLPEQKQELGEQLDRAAHSRIILIGPEGDFTPNEIELALQNNFLPVALGNTRLRTETAGMVAATLLKMI